MKAIWLSFVPGSFFHFAPLFRVLFIGDVYDCFFWLADLSRFDEIIHVFVVPKLVNEEGPSDIVMIVDFSLDYWVRTFEYLRSGFMF